MVSTFRVKYRPLRRKTSLSVLLGIKPEMLLAFASDEGEVGDSHKRGVRAFRLACRRQAAGRQER
jgi:hypothetical protein